MQLMRRGNYIDALPLLKDARRLSSQNGEIGCYWRKRALNRSERSRSGVKTYHYGIRILPLSGAGSRSNCLNGRRMRGNSAQLQQQSRGEPQDAAQQQLALQLHRVGRNEEAVLFSHLKIFTPPRDGLAKPSGDPCRARHHGDALASKYRRQLYALLLILSCLMAQHLAYRNASSRRMRRAHHQTLSCDFFERHHYRLMTRDYRTSGRLNSGQ